MKISKKSWHYRFLAWTNSDTMLGPNPTLCSYVNVFMVTILMCFNVFMLTILMCFLFVFVSPLLLAMVGIAYLIDQYEKYKMNFPTKPKEKKPNIFMEWIKAKKRKICPLIEFDE